MYITGANGGRASAAQCAPGVCVFTYSAWYTPIPWGYSSLGGSGGGLGGVYRAYGLVYGSTADVTADSSYTITQGGYCCSTDPSLQYRRAGASIVDAFGTGIVKWCAEYGAGC